MLLKGEVVAEAFYPFVENGSEGGEPAEGALQVQYPARIAVFDDPAAAPRVVVVEPADIRTYLEEITSTVTRLAQEQGGSIPFTVIREVVENLIHAYFIEPTVSILDHGNTIRFSDQGPGIADKRRALEFGTTSATIEMKHYIRGVGSGLPYAQQWLEDKGGSLTVEDNMHKGTVVTISLTGQSSQNSWSQGISTPQQNWGQPQQAASPYPQQPYPQQGTPYPAQQPYPQQQTGAWPQAPAQPWQQPQAWGYPQQMPAAPQGAWQQPWPTQGAMPSAMPAAPTAPVSERGLVILDYLRTHDSVGPRDLVAVQPLSEATWSRALKELEEAGLISKQGGQKRRLTDAGRRFLGLL